MELIAKRIYFYPSILNKVMYHSNLSFGERFLVLLILYFLILSKEPLAS